MKETAKIKKLYKEIQNRIFYMIPQKWEKIYLYASVVENMNYIETGEMFFYYLPKGILKKNYINVYEIPTKFNIDEEPYLELAEKLYETIKDLRAEFIKNREKPWSNITISINNSKFKIEYKYGNLLNSKYSNNDRHVIWKYNYLDEPLEKFTKKEQKMIREFILEEKLQNDDTYTYEENTYKGEIHNVIEYDKDLKEDVNYDEIELKKIINKVDIKNKKIEKKKKIVEENQELITTKNQILNI